MGEYTQQGIPYVERNTLAEYIHVDVETTGLDARKDKLRIVSIDGRAYDFWKHDEAMTVWHNLRDASNAGTTFVAHNAQFDLDFLYQSLPELEPWGGSIYDTMVASQLMTAGRRISNSLDAVAERLLGIPLDKTFQKADWSRDWIDDQMLEYAANDTRILPQLRERLDDAMYSAEVMAIFKLEMALLPALLNARRKGVRLDVRGAHKLISSLSEEASELEAKLPYTQEATAQAVATGMALFDDADLVQVDTRKLNPRSPSDVATYFGLLDATEDTLREYIKRNPDDREAQTVRDIKKKQKKASTIRKQLLTRVSIDGRIHPWFNQTFVETGRLSSREPNLQNQDRGSDVRGLFVPAAGSKFVISDYSQLELRLAAYFSGDKNMLDAYRSGRDLHTETQLNIFGNPQGKSKDEAKRDRTLSKNINFGLVYGGGAGVLIRFAAKSGIEIIEEEAVEYRNAFRSLYPGLVRWQERQGNTKPEYVRTVRGRRRYITPGEGFCTRINSLVQGTAADGMKLALVELYKANLNVLLNVHDEIVVEVPEETSEHVSVIIVQKMVDSMYRASGIDPENPIVPIEAEVDIGNSWAEKS